MAKGSGAMGGMKTVLAWTIGVAVIALVLLIMLILFGNLSGNVGFSTDSAGYNTTQDVILNYTQGAVNTSTQFPVVGTIIGVALLLLILIGVLVFAITKLSAVSSSSNASFG